MTRATHPRTALILLGLAAAILAAALAPSAVARGGRPTAAQARFAPPAPCGGRAAQTPDIRHIIVIVFENKSPTDVIGPAPYLTALSKACGLATNYSAITHPSLPNYLAMTSGGTDGLSQDCSPQKCPQTSPSIFSQLAARHMLWQSFMESMPSNCSLNATNIYAPRHNPAVYYTNLRSTCAAHDLPMGTPTSGPFHTALAGHLGVFVFIAPNECNDMHTCSVATGDTWLQTWIPAIRRSAVYQAGHTAIVITFDEGSGSNQVATVVISPYIRPGTRSNASFNHYALLHASEYALGINTFLGAAATNGGFGSALRLR